MSLTHNISKKGLLVILDGFGINHSSPLNAVEKANTPNLDRLFNQYPYCTINASGESVGLPNGIMGNSEVGHLNLGSGRKVQQDLVRINKSIKDQSIFRQEKWKELLEKARSKSKRIHILGLLSDGGVHSHINHIQTIIDKLSNENDFQVYLHAFMDGRDTPPKSGHEYLKQLNLKKRVHMASMQGRSIAMDRDSRWEKTQLAFDTLTGRGQISNIDPSVYIQQQYDQNITDEFITPQLFDKSYAIQEDDCVFFINFRPDRTKQLTLALTDPKFQHFNIPVRPFYFLCMTPYVDDEITLPILFDKEKIQGGLSEYLSHLGLKQFKIAETEKFAHITYFFNGGRKQPFEGEDRTLVPSPRDVATYDLKPQMSAIEVTQKLVEALDQDQYSFYLVNFANPDMVGHTGNFEATKKALETIDQSIGQIMESCQKNNIAFALTADHGNCDQMIHSNGTPHTAHTTALVPFAVFHPSLKGKNISVNAEISNPALKDVAPTMLHLLGLEIPKNFEGRPIFL